MHAVRSVVGHRRDWVRRPSFRLSPREVPGPLIVAATVAVSWLPFSAMPVSSESDPIGLYLGASAIVLMAWSFVLALRLDLMESLFGGLDRAYTWHRIIGILSVVAMWLHIQQPNAVDAVPGASPALAETGTGFAGFGEIVFYVLIAMSILRFVPYRWWRLTHKLLGVPYLFACFHFITAEKPYANISPWGAWFAVIMAVGAVAWVGRVVVRDIARPGVPHVVSAVSRSASVTDVVLSPSAGRGLRRRLGQFVFVKVQVPGLAEPHAFSVASAPDSPDLRVLVRSRGDWTEEAASRIEVGQVVLVEGPYGRLRLLPRTPRPTVWFAGGLGITPFLSALSGPLDPRRPIPHLFYSVSRLDDAMGMDVLCSAAEEGRLHLHLHVSAEGNRLTPEGLFVVGGFGDAHVVVCGPDVYAASVSRWARLIGARGIERESFDIRSGLGPDLSTTRLTAPRGMRWVRRMQESRMGLSSRRSAQPEARRRGM